MYQKRSAVTKRIRNVCMNIAVNIGCHILLLFCLMGGLVVAFLFHVSYLISTIVQKVWSIVLPK